LKSKAVGRKELAVVPRSTYRGGLGGEAPSGMSKSARCKCGCSNTTALPLAIFTVANRSHAREKKTSTAVDRKLWTEWIQFVAGRTGSARRVSEEIEKAKKLMGLKREKEIGTLFHRCKNAMVARLKLTEINPLRKILLKLIFSKSRRKGPVLVDRTFTACLLSLAVIAPGLAKPSSLLSAP
jgi:hypothetical protein